MLTCPNCSYQVPVGFKFCGTCGYDMAKLQAGAAPAAAAAPMAAPAAAAPMAAPAAAAGPARGTLVLIRPDGTEGESIPLGNTTPIGRDGGGLFASDSYLSPKHAVFTFKGAQLFVTDSGSLNGVYLRIDREVPVELEPGAIFRIGQEILRFELLPAPSRGADGVEIMGSPNPGFLGKVSLIIGRETTGNAFPIPPTGMHLGRERGDIIFPEDGYVSGLHCRIHSEGGKMMLTDVGSSNGTFVRVKGERAVKSGSMLLMGQQLFRAQY
jgi:pSer/pThr/pTyr-binding forkhead associated (FHA) protein